MGLARTGAVRPLWPGLVCRSVLRSSRWTTLPLVCPPSLRVQTGRAVGAKDHLFSLHSIGSMTFLVETAALVPVTYPVPVTPRQQQQRAPATSHVVPVTGLDRGSGASHVTPANRLGACHNLRLPQDSRLHA